MVLPFPWGPDTIITGVDDVTCEQREWMVKAVIAKSTTAAQLAKRFPIRRGTIQVWKERWLKHRPFQRGIGRPRILDVEGLLSVRDYCRLNGPTATASLRRHIKACYVSTLQKRGKAINHIDPSDGETAEPPSTRTMGRYLKALVVEHPAYV
jgi:hypothetical protein